MASTLQNIPTMSDMWIDLSKKALKEKQRKTSQRVRQRMRKRRAKAAQGFEPIPGDDDTITEILKNLGVPSNDVIEYECTFGCGFFGNGPQMVEHNTKVCWNSKDLRAKRSKSAREGWGVQEEKIQQDETNPFSFGYETGCLAYYAEHATNLAMCNCGCEQTFPDPFGIFEDKSV